MFHLLMCPVLCRFHLYSTSLKEDEIRRGDCEGGNFEVEKEEVLAPGRCNLDGFVDKIEERKREGGRGEGKRI